MKKKELVYDYQVENLTSDNILEILKFIQLKGSKVNVIMANTYGLTSDMIKPLISPLVTFEVRGPFTHDHIKRFGDLDYATEQNTYPSFIFYNILLTIEKIESLFDSNLKPLPYAYAVYNYLKSYINYDNKSRKDLKSLLLKSASGLGLATVYKEFLDRRNIPNRVLFASDYKDACNYFSVGKYNYLVSLANEIYFFDMTNSFTPKYFSNFDFRDFLDNFPFAREEIKEVNPIKLNLDTINKLDDLTVLANSKRLYIILARKDNSKLILYKLDNYKNYHKYFIADVFEGERVSNPRIIYSESDLLNSGKDFLANEFFSHERLKAMENERINYLGYIDKNNNIVNGTKVSRKTEKCYGAKLAVIIEAIYEGATYIYNYYGLYKSNGDYLFKEGEIVSDRNLLDLPQSVSSSLADKFLSIDNVKKKIFYFSGYLGYYND